MFVQSHLQRNRLHHNQHHNQLPLKRHKSNRSLNTASNLTLSSVNSLGSSLKKNAKLAREVDCRQTGSSRRTLSAKRENSETPIDTLEAPYSKAKRVSVEGDFLRNRGRSFRGSRQSVLKRDFSFEQEPPCGPKNNTRNQQRASSKGPSWAFWAFGPAKRSRSLTVESLSSSNWTGATENDCTNQKSGVVRKSKRFVILRDFLASVTSNLLLRSKSNLAVAQNDTFYEYYKANFGLIGAFLSNFFSYQLETWLLLANDYSINVCPKCEGAANMYTVNPVFDHRHHNHFLGHTGSLAGHLHNHNHHQPPVVDFHHPTFTSISSVQNPVGRLRPEADSLGAGSQHRFPRRHPLTSHMSMFGYESASGGSLKEDALSQFIINISDNQHHRYCLGNQQQPAQRHRPVLRQMSATNEPEEVYPAAGSISYQPSGSRPSCYNEPFPADLGVERRHRARHLMDKRYSNSWDCQENEQILSLQPSQLVACKGAPFSARAERSLRLEQLYGGELAENGNGAETYGDKKKTNGDREFHSCVHLTDRPIIEPPQKSREDSSNAPRTTLEVSPKTTNNLRPSSQNSESSTASKKPLGGFSPGKLSLAGAKRRFGFRQKSGLNSLSVQRSEEIVPYEAARQLTRELTLNSMTDSGNESGSGNNTSMACFVEGLGAGQIASRQALVSPYLGDIQLTISDSRDLLEVEVVRARQLQIKPGVKLLPSPHVKLYLMRNRKCIAKCKTSTITRTLNPLFQQQFVIREDYSNCILQVIVWADYGKKDRKSLMGIVQVNLSDLDISKMVVDWYRLFNAASTASSVQSSKALRQSVLPKRSVLG